MKRFLTMLMLLLSAQSSVASMDAIKETNPDLYMISSRFINKDAAENIKLNDKEKGLIPIVVLTVNQQPDFMEEYIQKALDTGVCPEEILEAIYQTAPYAGIPKAVISANTASKIFKKNKIKLPLKSQSTTDASTRYEKGLETQAAIFGEGIRNMKANTADNQKHIPQFLSQYCFGDFYTRGALDLKTRELLTVCMLAALGDTESQIKAHIQANIKMGNDKEKLISAITQSLPFIGFPRTLNALKYLNEIVPENDK